MSLILTKSSMPIDVAVGTASIQAICKATVQVQEEKADIDRILAAKAEAKIIPESIRVADGKVIADGVVRLEVPYVAAYDRDEYASDREPIRFFVSEEATFQAELSAPAAEAGMTASVDAEVDSFEVDVVGPKSLALTAIVKVATKVTSPSVANLVNDVADADVSQVELTKRSLFTESHVGPGKAQVTIRDAFQVPEGKPDIAELTDYTAYVLMSSESLKPSTNRVNANGTLDLRIVYAGDLEENPLVFLAGPQIDFAVAVDLPGATESTRLKPNGTLVSLTLQKVGSRTIQVEAVAAVDVEGTAIAEVTAVTDVTAKGSGVVDLQKTAVRLESLVGQVASPATVSETFAVGAGKANVDEVLMSFAKARIIDAKIAPDKVTLTGEADVYVTYAGAVGEEGGVAPIEVAQQLGLPFELSLNVSGVETGMGLVASCEVIEADAVKAGPRAIDVDVKLSAAIKVTEDVEFDAVTDAALVEVVPAGAVPSRRLTIYVVQHGDTLWKIARRYGKTMAKIADANKLAATEVYPGLKLLIPA